MNIEYKNIDIKHWSKNYKSLCISSKEIHDHDKEEINEVIENYIHSVNVDTCTVEDSYISFQLYLAIKMWAASCPNGAIVVGVMEIPQLINREINKPLHLAEIACISDEKDENKTINPVYFLENVSASGEKEDNIIYYIPESVKCSYNIAQPMIVIDKEI